MGNIERQWQQSLSRRKALAGMAGLIAGSPLLHAQLDPRPFTTHRRTPGLNEMFTAFDFEPVMFANVPQAVYDYTAHGDGGEWNLRRNRQAFDWVDLIPGKAVDPSTVDLSSQLLDLKLKYPIIIAPTATQVALHPDGEAGMYRAASLSSNTPMCLSNNSSQSIEQVAKGAQGQLWWQFYPRQDMGASQELLERAQGAGYTAMVITVDQQASYYERSQHDRNLGGRTGGAGRGGGRGGAATPRVRAVQAVRTIPKRSARRRSAEAPQFPARRGGHAGGSPPRRGRVSRRERDASGTAGSTSTRCGNSSRSPSSSKASSPPRTRASASSAASTASSCRITAADRWTTGRRRSKRCPRSSRP